MTEIATLAAHVKNITAPDELKNLHGWVVWRFEDSGGPKPNKVPYYIDGSKRRGTQGSSEDRAKLATFDAAKSFAARKNFDGVGLALMPEHGVVALDFDDCVTSEGIDPKVQELIAGTYAEYSPSGKGIRAFMKGQLADRKDTNKTPFGVEVFSGKGFVTVTGNTTQMVEMCGLENTLTPINDEMYHYYDERFGFLPDDSDFTTNKEPLGLTATQIKDALTCLNPDMGYDAWLKIGMAIHFELKGDTIGFDLWNAWSSEGTKYKGPGEMQRKWSSFGRNPNGRVITGAYFIRLANGAGAELVVSNTASAEDFENIAEEVEPEPGQTFKYQLISASDFSDGPPPTWVIKNVLPEAEVGLLIGPPGSGKSFFALDMGMAIARGGDWRDHKVKQGRVVYIAAEGGGGVRKRLTAYEKYHQFPLKGLPFDVINASPDFLQKDDVLDLAKAIAYSGGARVVIVDTFAQVTPGSNENSGEDMSVAIKHCQGIHKATGAMVLLVHHVGKDVTKGARGWSGLKGAADCEIEVGRTRTGERFARVSKQKDGDDSAVWGFELEVVPVGVDEDGDVIDSCVVVESSTPMPDAQRKRRGPNQVTGLEVLSDEVPTDGSGVSLDYLIDEMKDRMDAPSSGRDTRKQKARSTLRALLEESGIGYMYDGEHVTRVL